MNLTSVIALFQAWVRVRLMNAAVLAGLIVVQFLFGLAACHPALAYSPEDLAGQTISNVLLSGSQLQFEDRGLIRDTVTHYQVFVLDKNGTEKNGPEKNGTEKSGLTSGPVRSLTAGSAGKVLFKSEVQPKPGNRMIVISLGAQIRADHDHLIRISVKREGKNLSEPLSFEKEIHQLAQLNPQPYADQTTISALHPIDNQILFTDTTPNDGKVETRYRVKLQKRVFNILWESTFAEAEFNRKDVAHAESSTVKLPISAFGVKPDDISSIEIEVTRISPRLKGASPIRFEKKLKI
ncbi:MAG: hypothetical protein H7222_16025 [Methylotenera sp.]|nr:hypothetical protein [Oligoflexia bacterium]